MTKMRDLHAEWVRDPEYREQFDALEDEFALVQSMIDARMRAGLTQEELATRMHTSQSVIARLEAGRTKPSTRTLERFAQATGARLRITFEAKRPSESSRATP